MRKALIATILVALCVCVTAQANPFGNVLEGSGRTSPICRGQNNIVTCNRQDEHGYSLRISTTTVTVGVPVYAKGHGYIIKALFTVKQVPGASKAITPNHADSIMLYAGIYCDQNFTGAIMCVPNTVTGYGIEIDTHHVVVLNVTTGQMVFSKVVP